MKQILMSVMAVALGVGASETAWASGPRSVRVVSTSVRIQSTINTPVRVVNNIRINQGVQVINNVRINQGVRFFGSTFFSGGAFNQFRFRQWNSLLGCWTFFDPATNSWFYWSARNGTFFPLSYASVVGPNGVLPSGINALPNQLPPGQTFPLR